MLLKCKNVESSFYETTIISNHLIFIDYYYFCVELKTMTIFHYVIQYNSYIKMYEYTCRCINSLGVKEEYLSHFTFKTRTLAYKYILNI